MIAESYLREVEARLQAVRELDIEVVYLGGRPHLAVEIGGHRIELRVTGGLDPAGGADVLFIGHARSDMECLIDAIRGGRVPGPRDRQEIEPRRLAASPAPWTDLLECDGSWMASHPGNGAAVKPGACQSATRSSTWHLDVG